MDDNTIKELFLDSNNHINGNMIRKLNEENNSIIDIIKYLRTRYNDTETLKESLYRVIYDIEEKPKCPICNKKLNFIGKNGLTYRIYCSKHCSSIGNLNKRKNTCISKYGVEHPAQSDIVKEKTKNTCISKYGVEHPAQSDIVKEKTKNTCISKYGVDNIWKSKEVKEKIYYNTYKKYGVYHTLQSEEIKNKIKRSLINHYGVDSYFKTEECKYKNQSLEAKEKQYLTKKRNHTFNTSKPEEELFLYIKSKFPNVKRQYKDKKRYPWCCDFYIPELDYFIELNGTWTHGKHPYDMNSDEDKSILKIWKEKSKEHPYYNNAIKTWTIRDVEKRNKAKENNLNFKEVWTLNVGKQFIDNLINGKNKIDSLVGT